MLTGASFVEDRQSLEEIFYIIRGELRGELASGEVLEWKQGDLVYWPYDQEMKIEYSAGHLALCYFWSDEPIPIPRRREAGRAGYVDAA
jgi:glyoxylate utilization-related uncharacterized protein